MAFQNFVVIFIVAVVMGFFLRWVIASANRDAREGGFNKK